MNYKRRLCLSCSPEAQGLVNPFKLLTMSYDRRLTKFGFRYLYKIKLLRYISIVVSARIGRFSQNGSHIYMFMDQKKFESYFSD